MKKALVLILLLSSCASGLKRVKPSVPPAPKSGRTVVLFLVDGLAVNTLQTGLKNGGTPQLQNFFLGAAPSFPVAQASFPTLTYPNISSVLTAMPVGAQPVISNHVVTPAGLVLNYEKAEVHPLLRATIDPISVIDELNSQGKETASFSFVFGMNANSHMRVGVREGLEYQKHNYQSLDARLLDNMDHFLRERDPHDWPEFIYVHLLGVDGFSHMFGPNTPEVQSYLSWLDAKMGSVLQTLAQGEAKGQTVTTILTADHGFTTTNRHIGLAKAFRKADLNLVITNEGRFLGLHLPQEGDLQGLRKVLQKVAKHEGVAFTAWKSSKVLEISNSQIRFRFALGPSVCENFPVSLAPIPVNAGRITPVNGAFRCPSDFDEPGTEYPFLVSQLARYLSAPLAPEAIVIAKPDTSFTSGQRGGHGGPTSEESFVPVLLRNASLKKGPVRTFELLKFLRNRSSL